MRRRAFVVAGLGFGDEGKGSVVDWLVRRHGATAVVRANGGPQAAHHIVDTGGRVHCASQLGAGVMVPGVRAHLARAVVVDPLAILAEDEALKKLGIHDAAARLSIDPRCIVVTPFHAIVNRMQEIARGASRHGSCGRGVAQAQLDAERGAVPSVRASDLADPRALASILRDVRLAKINLAEQLVDQVPGDQDLRRELDDLRRPDRAPLLVEAYASFVATSGVRITDEPDLGDAVVVEGAQGVLLDREHGFWPHVTPSRTTFAPGALFLAEAGFARDAITRVGVLRAYATRHGAGPFVTEDADLTRAIPDHHNGEHPWQGRFRIGWFDGPAARYAIAVSGGVDALVVTNVDRLEGLAEVSVCSVYEGATDFPLDLKGEPLTRWWTSQRAKASSVDGDLVEELEAAARVRVSAISFGPTADDKRALDDTCI
jgi:adenylosuccinate synthase